MSTSLNLNLVSVRDLSDHGVMHAHIWTEDFRRKGIGLRSYPLAALTFMNRFSLPRILFKTPLQNLGALRVKEKLGIRIVGEEAIDFGILRSGTKTKVFELTRAEALKLLSAMS